MGRGARAQVPAVLLVCRNSTDTAYFQRLRPYPRVLLRRQNARFKARAAAPRGGRRLVSWLVGGRASRRIHWTVRESAHAEGRLIAHCCTRAASLQPPQPQSSQILKIPLRHRLGFRRWWCLL